MKKPKLKRHSPEWLAMMRANVAKATAARNPPVSDADYIARLRGMIDAKDGRVARFLIERAERFIERAAGNKGAQRNE